MNNATIAIVGNPNCGKTTLFNNLTGGKIKTGNWPGVTVEKREGQVKYQDNELTMVDLPGIYSFSAHSEDGKVARDYILGGEPTLILNIVDATNLERNLYLTTQLIEMKVPIVVVVNMVDLAKKQNIKINFEELSKKLSVPVIGLSAINKDEIKSLKAEILKNVDSPVIAASKVTYPSEMELLIIDWSEKVVGTAKRFSIDTRWIALKILENEKWIQQQVIDANELSKHDIDLERVIVEKTLDDSCDIICADCRYGFIHSISKSVIKRQTNRRSFTDKLDKIVLNRFLGIPVFLVAMYLVFWSTISIGGAFIDFFDKFFGTIFVDGLGSLLVNIGVPGWAKVILADGVGGGIQTVATFVPIMFMMFFILSLLEDSGYMARAAFVMDKFMRFLGLPGKSFVPLLVGFGCTVPAIMATRTLESKKDRYLTIFMSPFMSCGARLPVYALFGAAFFPGSTGLIVFSLYLVGLIFAVLTGLLMKKTLFKGEVSHFIMELPPYHSPRIKHLIINTWGRLKSFIYRAGKVIVIVVLFLSVLNSIGTDGSIGNEDSKESVLAAIGKTITPIFTPMGIEKENWPATVGLFTGIFAKEAVVGTLNSLYGQIAATEKKVTGDDSAEEPFDFWGGIAEAFKSIPEGLGGVFGGLSDPLGMGVLAETDTAKLGEEIGADASLFKTINKYFTKGKSQAYAYLLFILLYFPCVAAFGALVKETGASFGVLSGLYVILLGWSVATLFYQITTGFQLLWIIVPVAILLGIVVTLYKLQGHKLFQLNDGDE